MILGLLCFLLSAVCSNGACLISFEDDNAKGVKPYALLKNSAVYASSALFQNIPESIGDGEEAFPIPCERDLFMAIESFLASQRGSVSDMSPAMLRKIMNIENYLSFVDDARSIIYAGIAEKSLGGAHEGAILETHLNNEEPSHLPQESFLFLLRAYASMHNIHVPVKGNTATLCFAAAEEYGDPEKLQFVERVRVMPSAFDTLSQIQGDRAGSSHEERVWNGWDVFIWILKHMMIAGLYLEKCEMNGIHVGPIASIADLSMLSLNKCGLKPGDIKPLAALKYLTELDVSSNVLSEEDASVATSFEHMEKLHMYSCRLRHNDLRKIDNLKLLKDLNIGINPLGKKDLLALAKLENLRKLYMHACRLEEGSVGFVGGLKLLEELDVGYNKLSVGDIEEIAKPENLEVLIMCGCDIPPDSLAPLGARQGLRVLDVSYNKLKGTNIQTVLSLANLAKLNISWSNLRIEDISPLAALARLEELDATGHFFGTENIPNGESLKVCKL